MNGAAIMLALVALALWRRPSTTSPAIVDIPPCEPMRANVLLRSYPVEVDDGRR